MDSGLKVDDPTVVAAFRAALAHQGLIALLIFAALAAGWLVLRRLAGGRATAAPGEAEPVGRSVLRVGFGLLWLLDGLLQAQPGMAVGLPSQVIEPTAASSPPWVQHLVNWAGTTWSYHPIQAGAAAVWIQAGIGLWLVAAPRGPLSRLGGMVSLGWGLVVWVFGESFGGIFAPGLSWLTGAPGAALVYCVAGALLALPERWWRTPRLGRAVLAGYGAALVVMAVLQAWPGRGFWRGPSGSLTGMVQSMSKTPQPPFLMSMVSGFGAFLGHAGFAVNLVAVIWLAATGLAFLSGRVAVVRPALAAFTVLCLADWVLVQDFGFFGGLGTDPNSMIPMALLACCGYLALTRVPVATAAPEPEPGGRPRTAARAGSVVTLGAIGVIALGAAPMAAAQASPSASSILADAINGPAARLDYPAPAFALTDQHGEAVSLASLRGKVVLLTFLDPVCVTDCPLVAQQFRSAGQLLGANASRVELVAVDVNPLYYETSYTQAFDQQEGLAGVADWRFLTGTPARLRQLYRAYGVPAQTLPAGAMLAHDDIAFVIDTTGRVRETLDMDPGPGTAATQSSFASELATAATGYLAAS